MHGFWDTITEDAAGSGQSAKAATGQNQLDRLAIMSDRSPGPENDRDPGSATDPAAATRSRTRRWFDWLFRNRQTGRITIAQLPNIPLWLFLATVVTRRIVPAASAARTVIDIIGVGALSWWAVDELLRGVNPWRRFLGLAGCAFSAAGLASLVR